MRGKLALSKDRTIVLDALFVLLVAVNQASGLVRGAGIVLLFGAAIAILSHTLFLRLKPIPLLHSFATVSGALLLTSISIDPGAWPMHLTCLVYAALSRRILFRRIELRAPASAASSSYARSTAKRCLDLTLVFALAPIWLPAMFFIGGVSALLLRGSPLFKQEREGLNGKGFQILKFRTLGVSPAFWFRFQRKTGLDELPQILNIIRGEMSFVGPRPELLALAGMIPESARERTACRPGLTGLWQISPYRSEPIHQHTELDVFYSRSATLSLDLSVILLTPLFLFAKKA